MYAETNKENSNNDIYGNFISNFWDDGIQPEGYSENMRVWGNFIKNYHHGSSSNPITIGPMYIWKNVIVATEVSSYCDYSRGGFLKTTSTSGQGMIYIIHKILDKFSKLFIIYNYA